MRGSKTARRDDIGHAYNSLKDIQQIFNGGGENICLQVYFEVTTAD